MATKKDNRLITTSFTYDALNRPTQKTYSDSTPPVSYSYDTAGIAYSIGRLTQMASNGIYTNNRAFDPLGNVTAGSQLTASKMYPFSYTYNLAGALTSEMLPSGRKLNYGYDGAGRENSLGGVLAGQGKWYVNYLSYTPDNQISLMDYGNNVWHAVNYNNRMQPYRILDVINNDPNQTLVDQTFDRGTTNNNGNINAVVTRHGGPGYPQFLTFKDYYWYDGLNRVSAGNGKDVNENLLWAQNFGYDRYGNRWVTGTGGLPVLGITPQTNVFTNANQIGGASYDAAGNLLLYAGSTLTYDAENRLTSTTQSGIGSMYYSYDGIGRRVQEISTYNTEKVFVYDVFGRLSAEYSVGMAVPPCTTCYISTDHLGSTRLVTDENHAVVARHDYTPFGEEIPAGYAGRLSEWGAADFVNQKFTGQERDTETGLDFFQARYFSAALGRFNSPDPENAGADLFNPQSWNGYSYVGNNPLTLIDPTGLDTCPAGSENNCVDVNGGPPDPVPTDPCFFFNCWSGGFGYYGPPQQPVLPPAPPPPPNAPIILANYEFDPISGIFARQGGSGPRKGERKTAAKPSGTPNPGKHVRPSKTHPGQWEVKNPHTGTWILKPPGWTPTQGMIIVGTVGATVTAASILSEIFEGLGIAVAVF